MHTPPPATLLPAPRRIAVVGAGAVGSYFGALLALAGQHVTLIGRAAHMQAVQRHGLQLRRAAGGCTVWPGVATELAAVRGADLVLVCVKSGDTAAVAQALAPLLDADACVLSLQNGVQNLATLQAALHHTVLPVVVYAAVALAEPGVVQHHGGGELVIGPAKPTAVDPAAAAKLQAVAALFAAAGVVVRLAPDALAELWAKLVVNCACNAVSALAQAPYAAMAALPAVHTLQRAALQEAVAVAQAEGQALSLDSALAAVEHIGRVMPAQRSSTAQDLARGRHTEIEHLNGHIVRRGAVHGIATPVNQALLALVQLAEAVAPR